MFLKTTKQEDYSANQQHRMHQQVYSEHKEQQGSRLKEEASLVPLVNKHHQLNQVKVCLDNLKMCHKDLLVAYLVKIRNSSQIKSKDNNQMVSLQSHPSWLERQQEVLVDYSVLNNQLPQLKPLKVYLASQRRNREELCSANSNNHKV